MPRERLQKYLASAGLGSRRNCEEFITANRITVNGEIVNELGSTVDPDSDVIRCDGERLKPEAKVYFLLNKPDGVICTTGIERQRMRAIDLVPNPKKLRLFTIGRLDTDSEGLIIVTNDGDIAEQIAHPRYEFPKTYRASIVGSITGAAIERLQKGIYFREGKTAPAKVRIVKRARHGSVIEITIHEGFNRQVRRMLSAVGHPVKQLCRISVGPIKLGKLRSGEYRVLTHSDMLQLIRV